MSYVCFKCRYRAKDSEYAHLMNTDCPKCGKALVYVHFHLPARRDDHKMWQLAERKARALSRRGRPRRRRRVVPLADWERELLNAAKK